MRRRSKRIAVIARLAPLALAMTLALGLAACGNDSGNFTGDRSGSFQVRPAGATAAGSTP